MRGNRLVDDGVNVRFPIPGLLSGGYRDMYVVITEMTEHEEANVWPLLAQLCLHILQARRQQARRKAHVESKERLHAEYFHGDTLARLPEFPQVSGR